MQQDMHDSYVQTLQRVCNTAEKISVLITKSLGFSHIAKLLKSPFRRSLIVQVSLGHCTYWLDSWLDNVQQCSERISRCRVGCHIAWHGLLDEHSSW